MAQKKLKLAFCMGGGVSLGAFSGGALAEILRQILYPEAKRVLENEDRKFGSIEIDVFMGASAGSLTLAMMLRGLAYSFPDEGQLEGDMIFTKAKSEFDAIFGEGEFDRLRNQADGKELANGFVAAARVESLQYRAWVEEVSIANLCQDPDAGTGAGLFDTRFLGRLGARLLGLKTGGEGKAIWRDGRDTSGRSLLADRVVFGSTITPMHPLDHPAAEKYFPNERSDGDPVLRALLNRGNHRDARLFDIRFKGLEGDDDPSQWVRVQDREAQVGNRSHRLSLHSPETWQEILRTSLASGAVPVGFTPVVLKRHQCEWGANLPSGMATAGRFVEMPYVDGGMFNNEPVEETDKICRFLDADDPEIERVVFFVDSDFPAPRVVRRFSYQGSVLSKAEFERRRTGPNHRSSAVSDRFVEYEAKEPIDGALGVLFWSASALYGHARVTRKTPVIPNDFCPKDPEFLENVLAIGPVVERGGRLAPADLRGEPLGAFAGFLSEAWRRHDFERGRRSVYDTLRFGSDQSVGLAKRLGWSDKDFQYRLARRNTLSLNPEEIAERDRSVKLLADHIDAHMKDLVGFFKKGLLDVALPFLGVPGWRELIESGLNPPPGREAFELVLPGDGWKLRVAGLEDSEGHRVVSEWGEAQTVFGLLIRDAEKRGGPIHPDLFEDFEIHVPWVRKETKIADSVYRNGADHSPIRLNGSTNELRQHLREMVLHGAIGLRLDLSGAVPRWRLYQPPNPIDIGLRQVT